MVDIEKMKVTQARLVQEFDAVVKEYESSDVLQENKNSEKAMKNTRKSYMS